MAIIEYENKKYFFSWNAIILFPILSVVIALAIWYGTDYLWEYTHKIVVEQTVAVINWFTKIGLTNLVINYQKTPYGFEFIIPGKSNIGFENACTGVQAIAIFAGIIIATPHSKDKDANKRIWLRKLIALIVSSLIFYVVNILRMVLQLNLYYEGANWNDIHVSISAASSFIAAVIMILMHKWLPEFILTIVWIIAEFKEILQKKNKKRNRN
ncbi:MAG: archaeosortase H [Promethearchaeota archaeon]